MSGTRSSSFSIFGILFDDGVSRLTSWLSFAVSNFEFVTFLLVSWIFYVLFCLVFAMSLCASVQCALWSPAGKRLTSWFSFVVSNCEFVTFPLVSWIFYVFVLSCVYYVFVRVCSMCFVVTCWERADLLALVCGV